MLYKAGLRKLPIVLVGLVVVGVLGVIAVRALTPSDITVTLRDVSDTSIPGGYPDVLGLDMTISPPRGDRLDALFVKQAGTAQWNRDLTDAKLWADAGATGFQGVGVDRIVTSGQWNATESGWAFTGMDEVVAAEGTRFFVTVSTYRAPTSNRTIQLGISEFLDANTAMAYDIGDRGIFLRTARPAPATAMTNVGRQTIRTVSGDSTAPLVRITEPAAGVSLAGRTWLLVRGVAQDRGGSSVAKVRVGLNRVGHDITWVDAVPEVAGFATWEARFFELPSPQTFELRVQAEDWVGNRSAVSDPMAVELK